MSVARLCVAQFADFCSVYLRSNGPAPVAVAARDDARFAALRDVARDDAYNDRAREIGIECVIEEPLAVSGRVLGTLVVGLGTGRRLTAAHRRSLAHFASILSTSVDQAEQLAIHYHVSKRLQQALLPSRLASVDGIVFDAAYLPATAGTDVGGDWYDTFEIGNGLIGLSVGDVVGHGLEAAVAMSEIRGAIRATAATNDSPSAVLRLVDELMVAQGVGMATAIVGFYDPRTGVLTYASSGHPAPVLLWPGGHAVLLPAGGLILGLGMPIASDDITVTVPRGGTVVLYTDGLLEYGRDVVAGEEQLLDTLRELRAGEHRYADALHAQLFGGGVENADDCATLTLHRLSGAESRSERLVYSSIAQCAGLAREAVRHFSEPHVDALDRRFDIVTAVGEAIANAIEHGTHGDGNVIEIDADAAGCGVVVEVRNRGHWRSFTPSIDRGRGLHIMRSCATKLEIASAQNETCVKLTFSP